MLNTTTATVEPISTTAFPSPSTISNATVFHGVLLGRVKLSDIDFFLWSVDASMLQVYRLRLSAVYCDSASKFLVALLLLRDLLLFAKHLFVEAMVAAIAPARAVNDEQWNFFSPEF